MTEKLINQSDINWMTNLKKITKQAPKSVKRVERFIKCIEKQLDNGNSSLRRKMQKKANLGKRSIYYEYNDIFPFPLSLFVPDIYSEDECEIIYHKLSSKYTELTFNMETYYFCIYW